MSATSLPSSERIAELRTALSVIRSRVAAVSNSSQRTPTLVAVSKYKPAEDVRACYDAGHRDFGENYAQQLVEKAAVLPLDVRWHFIGTVQSNKAKVLAGIENLYTVQTLASTKLADALNRHRAAEHAPLRVLIQLNTSGEEAKGGIAVGEEERLAQLAAHVVRSCPRLRLVGLMTIGAAGGGEQDFAALRGARDRLVSALPDDGVWGEDVDVERGGGEGGDVGRRRGRRLLLSMGMSHDFELALKAGADIVRVGTGIFGARPPKEEQS
ncbi:hypothetical protein BJV74DRAFT_769538 [Russula compacta]|nr:hypothetical protein BJV74DRAFT_769538 [Russula compacta]